MSVVWRILSLAALAVSAGVLFLSILSVRKEQRVRTGLDLIRLGITLVTTVLMARLLGVDTSEALMGMGLLVGLLLGVYEGLHLRVRFLGKGTFARRTALGVAAWGLGVVVVQVAGVIGRVGLADFGLALSFLGIGQVVGLLTGRWQTVLTARRAGSGAVAALLLLAAFGAALLPGSDAPARAADAVDVRSVAAGQVPGLTVEIRGNGAFFGPALSLVFGNETGEAVTVAVPVGLLFVPENEATQTMVAAGGEAITVPTTERGAGHATEIQAFCGQYHDGIPSVDDVFSPGDLASGDLAALVTLIHQEGVYGRAQQEAIWSVTDGRDISQNPEAEALVEAALAGPNLVLSAGEGTRTSVVGLGGAAALLLSALAGSGNTLGSAAAAFRGRGGAGLRDLLGGTRRGVAAPDWIDPEMALAGGRAGAALEDLPAGLRPRVQEALAARLMAEQTEALLAEVRAAVGPVDPAADAAEVFHSNPKAVGALGRVPAGVRSRFEEQVLAGLQQQQAADAAGETVRALRRDHAVEVVRQAVVRRDGSTVQRAMAALGEEDRARVWPRATAGLDLKPGDLEYPTAAAEAVGVAPAFDPDAYLDADPAGALVEGGEAEAVLARLPAATRARAQDRLAGKLAAERASRWVEKLREAAGSAGGAGAGAGAAPGSVLDVPEVQSLLGMLPPGLRERVGAEAARLIDGEAVEKLAAAARRVLEQERGLDLLRTALGLNDGDGADAVMNAVGAALDVTNQADLEGFASRAVSGGTAALARLSRTGVPAPSVDLTEHLVGEADLLGAVRRVGGVEGLLQRAGGLRPQVEAELARVLEADRLDRAVRRAAETVSPEEWAASDLLGAVRELPGIRELLGRLPEGSRQEAYRMLGERLDASGFEAAVGEVGRALHLDRAEEALRRAAAAGDLDAADRALAGLNPDQVAAVSAAALGG